MAISLSFCPEPGGGTPRLKPLAGTLSTDEDTRPSPATTPTRIDILGLLCVTTKTADCTREQLTLSGLSSITPDCSIMPVACKTSAAKAFDSKDVADACATCKRMIQGIGCLLDVEQTGPILWIDNDAESDSTNQGCLSDFMVDDISDMAPSHAQFCNICSEVACCLDCLHSRAGLSIAGHALDAFCSETLKNVRGLKAPLLEREQLLGFNCRWSMHHRGHYVGNIFYDGNKASMAMRQYQNLGVTERFEQAKISSSSPETFRTIKHLSDLVTQLISLFPYAALLMVRASYRTTSLPCPWLTNS